MTIAELGRAIESRRRVEEEHLKERAVFDYTLALLIGSSVSRIYSSSAEMPAIEDAYPSLFGSVEEKQARKDETSIIRFKQFAQSFNHRFKKEANQ